MITRCYDVLFLPLSRLPIHGFVIFYRLHSGCHSPAFIEQLGYCNHCVNTISAAVLRTNRLLLVGNSES